MLNFGSYDMSHNEATFPAQTQARHFQSNPSPSNGSIPGGYSSSVLGSTLTLTPTPSEARTITSSTVAAIKR